MRLWHDSQNIYYRAPFGAAEEGAEVTLRLFVDSPEPCRVLLCLDGEKISMHYLETAPFGKIYEAKVSFPSPCLAEYYFEAGNHYYGNNAEALGGEGMQTASPPEHKYRITVYKKGFKTPDFFKEAIVYQIFPDRFFRFGDTPRQGIVRRFGDIPYYKAEQFGGEYKANDFFGGNLAGIEKKLPYLSDLGVSVIYLNPIFKSFSNHGYDTGDYENVKEAFGANEAFISLCEKAREHNIKIVLDGVFSHTGSDSKYFNKNSSYDCVGAYNSTESPYFGWYSFTSHPDEYDCWWGFKTLPNVNEMSESYLKYMITGTDAIINKWPAMGSSGWRLDVADELPDEFLETLRSSLKKQSPDAVIIGEVWEDASSKISYGKKRRYLLGNELDGVMNYPLRNAIISFVMGRLDAAGFRRHVMSLIEGYPREALLCCMNFLSSHDVARILTVLGGAPESGDRDFKSEYRLCFEAFELAKRRLRMALALLFTMPGAPCIYYADEAGAQGYEDPFNRQTFPWEDIDGEIFSMYRYFSLVRRGNRAFVTGELKFVYEHEGCTAYTRSDERSGALIIINADPHEKTVCIHKDRISNHTIADIKVNDSTYRFTLPPMSCEIIDFAK